MVAANKSDLNDRRTVSVEEGEGKARDKNVMFMEVSAKSGNNIKLLFKTVA